MVLIQYPVYCGLNWSSIQSRLNAAEIRLHNGTAPQAAKKVIVFPFGRSSGLSPGLSISQATIPHLSFCRAASVLFAISFSP
jgi:hypothetical protein